MTQPESGPEVDAILAAATPEQLRGWAACWVQWWTPAAIAYRTSERERWYERRIKAVSHDLAAATEWSEQAPIGRQELLRRRYPWLHDPDWRCAHQRPHGQCPDCASGHGAVDWLTGQPITRGGPRHWLSGEAA